MEFQVEMTSENYPLRRIGIYHNLPTFDPSIKGLTAIITGANGISGFYTMRALLDSPERWSKIYALSRRPPSDDMMNLLTAEQRSRVELVTFCNLRYLQPARPSGAPFCSNAEELVKVNSKLFENFVVALEVANVKPRPVLLQTGAKNYGVHIGAVRQPSCESDPQPKHLEPNFYYPQEQTLFDYCKRNPSTGWNVIRPTWIVGAAANAQMNALHTFAIYAAVQAHKGQPLYFYSDWESWQYSHFYSTARLTGYFSEWTVLEEKCKNEAFSSVDTSPLSFDRFYEKHCRWYGAPGCIDPDVDDSKYQVIVGQDSIDSPIGRGPSLDYKYSFSLVQWANDPVNVNAWKEIMEISNGKITQDPFKDPVAHFSCGDAATVCILLCMNKARRLGWMGFVDTIESVFEMYHDMVGLGMLPPIKVDSPKALI